MAFRSLSNLISFLSYWLCNLSNDNDVTLYVGENGKSVISLDWFYYTKPPIADVIRAYPMADFQRLIQFSQTNPKGHEIDDFQNDDSDLNAAGSVAQLLDSLEEVQILSEGKSDDIDFLHHFLDNNKFQSLLEIYDRVQEWSLICERPRTHIQPDATQTAKEAMDSIEIQAEEDDDCFELQNIMKEPNMVALLDAHDNVLNVRKEEERQSVSDIDEKSDTLPKEGVTRVRLVQFQKAANEPMGITLKLKENRCFVARIMHGGMIHRQGTLHPGDEIKELDGESVENKSIESLQSILKQASGTVTFKIVPSFRHESPERGVFVKAWFEYDPRGDELIPCQQAGLSFQCGDILEIVCKTDFNWWQAVKVSDKNLAGLVPSPELQEWRVAYAASEKARKSRVTCLGIRRKKRYKDKYVLKYNTVFDQLDLVTYEEVVQEQNFKRKTLVLLGAHGVGRRHIKNTLINLNSAKYAYPIPHTTRKPKPGEEDGKNYFFISTEAMLADVDVNKYLEFGSHEGAMYGTKLDTVRDIISQGKMPLLDVEPQCLKSLRCSEFAPYIVFIAVPPVGNNADSSTEKDTTDESLLKLARDSELLEQKFGHLFDLTVVNQNIDDTIMTLEHALTRLENSPQWIPASWIY